MQESVIPAEVLYTPPKCQPVRSKDRTGRVTKLLIRISRRAYTVDIAGSDCSGENRLRGECGGNRDEVCKCQSSEQSLQVESGPSPNSPIPRARLKPKRQINTFIHPQRQNNIKLLLIYGLDSCYTLVQVCNQDGSFPAVACGKKRVSQFRTTREPSAAELSHQKMSHDIPLNSHLITNE